MSNHKQNAGVGLCMCFLALLGTAMYFTIIGTSFQGSTVGTLKSVDVTQTTNKGSTSYYVKQTFEINWLGRNTTCSLTRPTVYYFYGSAKNFQEKSILGTKRTVWVTSYNSHTCYDEKIKNYNRDIGVTLFSLLAFFVVCVGLLIWADSFSESYTTSGHRRGSSSTTGYSDFTFTENSRLSTITKV
jgi:hypothetical protein